MPVTVHAQDMAGTGIAKIRLYVGGVQAAEATGNVLHTCLALPQQSGVQVLAVAQNAPGTGALLEFPPKGWLALGVDASKGGSSTCGQDGGAGTGGSGAGGTGGSAGAAAAGSGGVGGVGLGGSSATPPAAAGDSSGCGCRAAGGHGSSQSAWLALCLGLIAAWREKRRRR